MKHYLSLSVDDTISFVQPTIQMAEPIFNLLDSDRKHIGEFLDFVPLTNKVEDEENFLKMKLTGIANGTDLLYLIFYKKSLAGTIDLHFIDKTHKKAEIGYWIHSKFANKGIISKSVNQICQMAFDDLELNKLTIIADTENIPSNKVAQKSGFSFVATDKEEIIMNGKFRDTNRYSLLKKDFHIKK